MQLSPFGRFVVDALTWRVRVIADSQLAMLTTDASDAKRDLDSLMRKRVLESFSMPVSLLTLKAPLFCWYPANSVEPDYGKICWQAEQRLRKCPAVSHTVFHATKLAERQFGGVGGKIRQPFQLVHDLGTASVFVAHTLAHKQTDDSGWTSEDILRRFFRHLNLRKIPDALIIKNDKVSSVIEFVGKDYSAKQIRRFHQYWAKKNTPYQLW